MTTSIKTNEIKIPAHLKQYVCEQQYHQYTAIDHAVWRYVMRQNMNFLDGRAHGAYVEGLKVSGMKVDSLPNVEEMNASLARFGWGAATIGGFIPGVAFFDFQGHGILPIATNIRTLNHIAYTPAPDIIHEAAGHAPIIHNEQYAEYLKIFGQIGAKAIATKEEHDVFEAIKHLSEVMEDGVSSEEVIKAAEDNLEEKQQLATEISEATLISRLFWWTVEYGLIGKINAPLIYGAGLLSSIGESRDCLTDKVKKIPFDLETCINTDYDVTKPQPQLFVCENFDQLIEAVGQFAETMAFNVGGTESVNKALHSGTTATLVYSSGLQVSGTVTNLEYDSKGEAIYVNTTGQTALAVNNVELPGHDHGYHRDGFGSPIGKLENTDISLEMLTDEQLKDLSIVIGEATTLPFASGVKVAGRLQQITREKGRIVLLTFADCTVTLGERTLFKPEWGTYDMAVGETIISVFAGAADAERFYADQSGLLEEQHSENVSAVTSHTKEKDGLNNLYQTVRDVREGQPDEQGVLKLISGVTDMLDQHFPNDWLLRLELVELMNERKIKTGTRELVMKRLQQLKEDSEELRPLIENGLKLL